MGIETVIHVPNPTNPNLKPKLVPPGIYYCMDYPECKGIQKYDYETEIKPCPLCGKLIVFKQ